MFIPILLVMLPIFAGLLQYIFNARFRVALALLAQGVLLGITLYLMSLPMPLYLSLSGTPLPFGMVLYFDRLTLLMLLLSNFVFLMLTFINSQRSYMTPLFLFLFLGLQGLINGIFMAYDLFNIYILIEVSTVTVSILIMFKRDSRSKYDGMIYLLVNMFAMTFYLLGIGYLYKLYGVLDFTSLKQAISETQSLQSLFLPYALIMTGISLKAALMPLFSWLPKAHGTPSAPSLVSAVLSGVYVKTGLYLIIRMQAIFAPLDMAPLFVVMGFITAITGIIFAIAQTDIKLILAYSTISQLGLMLIGISSSEPEQIMGGVYHLFNHGLFKVLLFIIAGLLIDQFGTRDVTKMKGLWRHSKFLSFILIIGIFNITGAPFFGSSYSKYYMSLHRDAFIEVFLFQLLNLGSLLYSMRFLSIILSKPLATTIFADTKTLTMKTNHWNKKAMTYHTYIGLMTLATVTLLTGVYGNAITANIIGVSGHMTAIDQIKKVPLYGVLLLTAFLVYKTRFFKSNILTAVRKFDIGFNAICGTVVSFFMGLLLILNYLK